MATRRASPTRELSRPRSLSCHWRTVPTCGHSRGCRPCARHSPPSTCFTLRLRVCARCTSEPGAPRDLPARPALVPVKELDLSTMHSANLWSFNRHCLPTRSARQAAPAHPPSCLSARLAWAEDAHLPLIRPPAAQGGLRSLHACAQGSTSPASLTPCAFPCVCAPVCAPADLSAFLMSLPLLSRTLLASTRAGQPSTPSSPQLLHMPHARPSVGSLSMLCNPPLFISP